MKVILGPTPCATCRAPVTVVRRDIEQPCESITHLLVVDPFDGLSTRERCDDHTHTLPDVGPFTTVDANGERHGCL